MCARREAAHIQQSARGCRHHTRIEMAVRELEKKVVWGAAVGGSCGGQLWEL